MPSFAEIYSRPEVVAQFDFNKVEYPEGELLREVMSHPTPPALLDLGVGAGRTTRFFAPLCGSYTGLDIAPGMIAKCREVFADEIRGRGWRFVEGSAADLGNWTMGTLDFVLFSFNGLDCLTAADRTRCLNEIFRVLRPGGIFLFSTHNLRAVNTLLDPTNPVVDDARRAALLDHSEEWQGWERANEMTVWDGVYGLDIPLRHHYVRPLHQVAVLEEMGFEEIEAQSAADGKVMNAEELAATNEFYLYFRARKPAALTTAATENESGRT